MRNQEKKKTRVFACLCVRACVRGAGVCKDGRYGVWGVYMYGYQRRRHYLPSSVHQRIQCLARISTRLQTLKSHSHSHSTGLAAFATLESEHVKAKGRATPQHHKNARGRKSNQNWKIAKGRCPPGWEPVQLRKPPLGNTSQHGQHRIVSHAQLSRVLFMRICGS